MTRMKFSSSHTAQKGDAVTLPAANLQAFLDQIEDLEDRLSIANAKGSGEETWPGDIVDRLIARDSPVRVFREYRGIKQNVLAETIGISKGFLSAIESGKKSPSIETYRKLADALDVTIDDLV